MNATPTTVNNSGREPMVWIASLSDYDAGYLVGNWIKLADIEDKETLQEKISAILADSYCDIAEEWAIHDTNNISCIGEYESMDVIVELAHAYRKLDKDLDLWEAFQDYCHYNYRHNDFLHAADNFLDSYHGNFDSQTEFAEEFVEDCGILECIPENLRYYFDYELYARDLFMDGFYMTEKGNVFSM